MRCEDLTPRLVDHLSGTLPDVERDGFERHLQSCEACRAELDALSEVWRKLGAVPASRPDPGRMRDRFDALLAAETAHAAAAPPYQAGPRSRLRRSFDMRTLLQIAAAI